MVNLTLSDGTQVNLVLKYSLLNKLNQKDPKVYSAYSTEMEKKKLDELGITVCLYTAYRCGCIEDGVPDPVSYEDFLELLPENHLQVQAAWVNVFYGSSKKKSNSRNVSKSAPEGAAKVASGSRK